MDEQIKKELLAIIQGANKNFPEIVKYLIEQKQLYCFYSMIIYFVFAIAAAITAKIAFNKYKNLEKDRKDPELPVVCFVVFTIITFVLTGIGSDQFLNYIAPLGTIIK